MSTVGVRELKNRPTQYLCRAKRGEEVIVTERGRPVAFIHPLEAGSQPRSPEGRLAWLAAQGFMTLPARKPLKRVREIRVRGTALSRMILTDRR